jgi:hypothetical protein
MVVIPVDGWVHLTGIIDLLYKQGYRQDSVNNFEFIGE